MEYLFHGRLSPSRTLDRSQLAVPQERKLKTGILPDNLLKEAVYFQRSHKYSKRMLSNYYWIKLEIWLTSSGYGKSDSKKEWTMKCADVLSEMYHRQTTTRRGMSVDCRHAVMIVHHFDEWAMKILMRHLEKLKSAAGSDEKLDHHVVSMFDILRHCLGTIQLDEKDHRDFELLRNFYGK